MLGERSDFKQRGLLKRLKKLSTCDVADALVRLDGGKGCLTDFNIYSPRLDGTNDDFVLAGPIFTVKASLVERPCRGAHEGLKQQMVNAKDTTSPRLASHFVDMPLAPETIMFIQAPPGTKTACWGGLLTTAAMQHEIQGVVIDGPCRDLKEHRDKGFPVIARSHSVLGQGGSTRPSEVKCPLTIHPLEPTADRPFPPPTVIESGNILLADINGVVVIDDFCLAHTIELAEKLKARDEEANDLISRQGHGMQEALMRTRPGYRVDA